MASASVKQRSRRRRRSRILGAEFAGYSDSGQSEITHQRPFVSVEPEADHCSTVENSENSHDEPETGKDEKHQDDHCSDQSSSNYARADDRSDGYAAGERPGGHNTASYIYHDANGAPYLRVVRTSAKQFPQFHWEGGRWLKGKPQGPKIPYRLPELIAAAPDIPVFICEGEKDVDNVAALGLIATTNSEGAGKGKWTADLNKWFAGKQTAYILEDNDDDGRRHAAEVASNLQHIVTEIRIVSFSELPPKGDVSDWLDMGGTRDELLTRAKAAPRYKPDGYVLVRASDIVPRAMDWLWHGHLLRGSQELLTGVPGDGKSQIHCAFVAYVTTGERLARRLQRRASRQCHHASPPRIVSIRPSCRV